MDWSTIYEDHGEEEGLWEALPYHDSRLERLVSTAQLKGVRYGPV
jgi:hypothetical protein